MALHQHAQVRGFMDTAASSGDTGSSPSDQLASISRVEYSHRCHQYYMVIVAFDGILVALPLTTETFTESAYDSMVGLQNFCVGLYLGLGVVSKGKIGLDGFFKGVFARSRCGARGVERRWVSGRYRDDAAGIALEELHDDDSDTWHFYHRPALLLLHSFSRS